MIYALLERSGNFGVVRQIFTSDKVLSPPRYIDVTALASPPTVGDFYNPQTGEFVTIPPPAELRNALRDIILVLENAGLVTRTF